MTSSRRRTREMAKSRNADLSDREESASIRKELERAKDPRRARNLPRVTGTKGAANWPEELERFQSLTLSITAQLDMPLLVKTILEQMVDLLDAERGILLLGRQNVGGLVPVLAVNLSGVELQAIDRVSRTILAEGKKGVRILTQDALLDPRFARVPSVQTNQLRSILCVPLVAPSSGQVGALYLDSPRANAFPSGVLPFFESLTRVAAVALHNAEVHGSLVRENSALRAREVPGRPVERIVGESSAAEGLREQALAVSQLDQPIVLVGEPGSGRSHLARIIHAESKRAHAPFVSCDCSVFSESQLKKTLLGRTGAGPRGQEAWETGLIRQANYGTLYISGTETLGDEISRALVRMVSEGGVRPLGGRHDERVDVRLILGTSSGRPSDELLPRAFRRIQPCQIVVPPLREHAEDIPDLLLHFLSNRVSDSQRKSTPTFTSQAIRLLQQQPWPGNVRELQQFSHRVLLLSAHRSTIDLEETKGALASVETGPRDTMGPWSGTIRPLKEWEEEALRQALLHTQGNKKEAARLLGIHRNTMLLKLKALEV